MFPFTAALRRVLEDQQGVAEQLKKAGVIPPYVFFYAVGKKTGQRITESGFNKAGERRGSRQAARVASRMTFVGPRFATSCELACRSAWRCSSLATRPALSLRDTTSSAVATCEMRRNASTSMRPARRPDRQKHTRAALVEGCCPIDGKGPRASTVRAT